uniref:SWIM-type zinc finger 7 associated protein 1 n=1 Tax=Oryzias latipes TaxID=8090 RepID=A0A3P9LIU2_ORYLA
MVAIRLYSFDSDSSRNTKTFVDLQLLLQVASLHESPPPPSLIVVDRLESFLRGPAGGCSTGCFSGEQSSGARLSALLCDTAAFLTQVLEQRGTSRGNISSRLSTTYSNIEEREQGRGSCWKALKRSNSQCSCDVARQSSEPLLASLSLFMAIVETFEALGGREG